MKKPLMKEMIKPMRMKTFEKAILEEKLTKAEKKEIADCTVSIQEYSDAMDAYQEYLNTGSIQSTGNGSSHSGQAVGPSTRRTHGKSI